MKWHLAPAAVRLRAEIDEAYPGRNKKSDGSISSATHRKQNPRSDHDPDANGRVHAIDVTGHAGHSTTEFLRRTRDPRIKYMISQGRMCSSYPKGDYPPWTWRPYSGSNKHDKHAHFSFVADLADDTRSFGVANPHLVQDEDMTELVKFIQQALNDAGHDAGKVDGVWGPKTQRAFTAAMGGGGAHTHKATVTLS